MNKKKFWYYGSAILVAVIISLIIFLQPEPYTSKVIKYELTTSDRNARVVFEITNHKIIQVVMHC